MVNRIVLALLAAISFGLWSNKLNSQPTEENKPACKASYVEQLAGPTELSPYMVITCGQSVSAYPIGQYPERAKGNKQPSSGGDQIADNATALADLNAQESMADSTWWIKWLTGVGLGISVFGLWLLVRNLNVANRTFDLANDATAIEFQPYLSIRFKKAGLYKTSDVLKITVVNPGEEGVPAESIAGTAMRGLDVKIRIANRGKSPASDIFVDFDGGNSYFAYTDKTNSTRFAAYRTTDARPSFSQDAIFLAEDEITARIPFPIAPTDDTEIEEDVFEAHWADSNSFELTNYQIIGLEVRYKDFTCRRTKFHKVVKGALRLTDDRTGKKEGATLWASTCSDSEHHHYKNYRPPT